ncbi:hypothetical protein GIB67_017637 [Kingdonia uniflora]|uniref:Autophagy-related protein 2 n=1 Tax=Kingdonia uniflora TaxID=39325 RepID=A0A7J7LN91_9MAGN|nr:hypothetical protein GIB67_017637 [Kingdonia uniflora]
MFPWNIAKSAEAMFSRWAIKHVLKFLLKKKLGQFILGDLDLDQLDVQLGSGTIQLTDLALNVDYINQKLGASPLIVKEGSIGSLLVKVPWSVKNCQIEIEELELVVVPCSRSISPVEDETSNQPVNYGAENLDHNRLNYASTSISLDVHEGVKTIAKMVQWLLTSFHVNVKKLIVAYDPCLKKDERGLGSHRALVLRITQIEYGTCVSEEAKAGPDSRSDSFLGMAQLTNFIKFQGAVIELLQMDGVDFQTTLPCASPSDATTPILTGEGCGFSGNLKLSIPWKNGTLDIHKVGADVSVDPLVIKLQPSTIMWILCLWDSFKSLGKDDQGHVHKSSYSVYHNSVSQFYSSTVGTERLPISRDFFPGSSSLTSQENAVDALLRGPHVIQDWVPLQGKNDEMEAETDFGASIDQFFECFDGLRTSQSALGNSGVWNWTCSVFSAITAASTLASGSLHIPSEQHVETNIKATVTGISVVLSLQDEHHSHSCDLTSDHTNIGQNIHYLGAKCQDLRFVLQICPREMKLEAAIKHVELNDYYFNKKNEAAEFGIFGCVSSANSESILIKHLQANVQSCLPQFPLSKNLDSEETNRGYADFPFHLASIKGTSKGINRTTVPKDHLVKVKLLTTSSADQCQFSVSSALIDGNLCSLTSFSIKLPPLIFWVNYNLVKLVVDLVNQIENAFQRMNNNKDSDSEYVSEKNESSYHRTAKGNYPCNSVTSPKGRLQGNIFLSSARVILCFPFESNGSCSCYSSLDQFIVLDISQSLSKETDAKVKRALSHKASSLIHLNIEKLNIYLITVAHEDPLIENEIYSAHEILSLTSKTDFSGITMVWQDGAITGPWIIDKARSLATSHDITRSRNKVVGKGYEFASLKTAGDRDDKSSRTRQEIILSSSFFIHVHLPPVSIKLSSSQYQLLHHLLNQIKNGPSFIAPNVHATSNAPQTSVLVECISVQISINLNEVEDSNSSIKKELPGSWNSFKLQIQKLELLSVSNIGGLNGGNFFWLSHGEGELFGSIGDCSAPKFLLVSCSNSTMRRGDGEGTNALSSGYAGTAIAHLSDLYIVQSITSVTIRCGTVIAPGGRLDWSNAICHFFSLPSSKNENTGVDSPNNISSGDSAEFVLNLVDVAMSYEPYFKNTTANGIVLESESNSSTDISKESGEQYVECLLAAASFNISNQILEISSENNYKIRVQDLGLLLCAISGSRHPGDTSYDVEHLHKVGYVKVAGEALAEAILRTKCKNGLLWELECSDSHIILDTCNDTTFGLTCLASQLQRLFAPDIQESVAHLQSRWKAVQQAQNKNESASEPKIFDQCPASSHSCVKSSTQDGICESRCGVFGLMDEICDNAFHFDGRETSPPNPHELRSHSSCNSDLSKPDTFSEGDNFNGSSKTGTRPESTRTSSMSENQFPKLIEGYYISGAGPLLNKSVKNQSVNTDHKEKVDLASGNCGWYQENSLRIVENHIFSKQKQLVENHNVAPDTYNAGGRVIFKNIDVKWRMYGGSDWHESKKSIQLSANMVGRDTCSCLELTLSGLNLHYDMFPDGEICSSKLALTVQDFHLYDGSRDAPWKLVLGYYHSKDHPRESSAKAFKLDLEAVRPDPSTPLEEYRLRLAFLPMLLHLDQGQLDFLISFFVGSDSSVDQSPSLSHDLDESSLSSLKVSDIGGHPIAEEALLPFFQASILNYKFDIWPVVIRVDYSPRHVDLTALRGGNYVHLVNLVAWKGIELQLKHVHAVGIYGWSSVCESILGEWLEDISQNQIHKFLKGLPPVRSLISVGSGAAKLLSLPVKNYRKDHKLLKGVQRGAIAFLRSISLEAVGLGVHLAAGAHDILLQTEYIVTSIPPAVPLSMRSKTKTSVRLNQPKDAQQGIQQAYESLSDGLGKTASALVGTPLKTYQRGGGAGSALASVVCAAPAAAIAPASAAMRAVHCALLGVRNSLDPEHKKESMDKYLGPSQPQGRS